ncbi:uncharacterized protein [Bemisia tabaci]|uniref:uncharacterized protein isoform X2 n=1 Tax=Bemisia tabaci TaxID=7038 RepID=UPI003B27D0CD
MNNTKKKNRANAGRSPRSFGSEKPLAVEGIYNNALFMHALANQIGNTIRVETQNGATFEGIFKAYSHNFEVALGMTHKVDPENPTQINVDEVKDVLIFKPQEIVCITATDVDLEYATRDTFQTDTAISKFNGQLLGERELEPWVGGCNGDDIELDVNDSNANGWDVNDMFRKNEQMYGIQSTFDHNLSEYTVQLQKKDTKDYKDAEAKAAKIANEIESNPSHRARVDVENGDEEEKYAAVVRPDKDSEKSSSSNSSVNRSSNSSNNSITSSSSISSSNNTAVSSSSSESGKYVPPAKRKSQATGKIGTKSSGSNSSNNQHIASTAPQTHQMPPERPPSSVSPVQTPHQLPQPPVPPQPQSQPQPPPAVAQAPPAPAVAPAPTPAPMPTQQVKKQSPPSSIQYHHQPPHQPHQSHPPHQPHQPHQAHQMPIPYTGPPAMVSQPPPPQPQPYPLTQSLPPRERQDQRVNGQIDQLPPAQPKGPRPPTSSYQMRSAGNHYTGPPRGPYQSEFMSGNRYQPVDMSQPRVPPPPQATGAPSHHHLGPPQRNAPAPPPPHMHHPQHVPHSAPSPMGQGGQMMPSPYPNSVPSMPPVVHPVMQQQPPQHIPPVDLHRKSPATNIVPEQHTTPSLPPRKQNQRRDTELSELKKFGSEFKLGESNVNVTSPAPMPMANHTEHDMRKSHPPQHQSVKPQPQPSPPTTHSHSQAPVPSPQRHHQHQQPPPPHQHQHPSQERHAQDRTMQNKDKASPAPSDDKSGGDAQENSNDGSSVDKVSSTLKKSTLNPNAKEFVYNPSAKPFTPVSNVSNRSPSTPVASRPHTPQTPNYTPMPMVMPAYVVAAQPTYPPTQQAAGNRYRKVIVPHRSDITSQMTAAAVTGQPLLAPAPIHAAPFTVPYTGPHIPPQPYQQMVRMVPQVPLVPTSISYHEPPTPQQAPTIQFMPPHHPTTPSPAHNGPGNQTPQNGAHPPPPPSYGQSAAASQGGGQHSSSGVGNYSSGPSGHPPPYHPIMCPIIPTGPPTGPPNAHHAAAMAAATQQQFIHHHQHPQIAGQHPQHIQVILPQNQ